MNDKIELKTYKRPSIEYGLSKNGEKYISRHGYGLYCHDSFWVFETSDMAQGGQIVTYKISDEVAQLIIKIEPDVAEAMTILAKSGAIDS